MKQTPLWTLTRDDFDRLSRMYRNYEANGGGYKVSHLPARQYAQEAQYYEKIGLARISQRPARPGDDGLMIYLTPLGIEIGKAIVEADRKLAKVIQEVADNFTPPEPEPEIETHFEINDPILRAAIEAFSKVYIESGDGEAATKASAAAAGEVLHSLNEDLITPHEAAEMTGEAESTWRNRCAAGRVPGAIKRGKQWLIPRSSVAK